MSSRPGPRRRRDEGGEQRADALARIDWRLVREALDEEGFAHVPSLLTERSCRSLRSLYDDASVPYRSSVDMARFNYGRGQYRYFDEPLPARVQLLRETLYPPLASIANDWSSLLSEQTRWPPSHAGLLDLCHAAGQRRPTPLLFRYGKDDYNCLHQDLYGSIHFPLQVVFLLSAPGVDFEGGEFILVEQRPRMQSRAMIVPLAQGDMAIFPVRERPRQGTTRIHRAQTRHGVARIRSGERMTLGVIFHDAK